MNDGIYSPRYDIHFSKYRNQTFLLRTKLLQKDLHNHFPYKEIFLARKHAVRLFVINILKSTNSRHNVPIAYL